MAGEAPPDDVGLHQDKELRVISFLICAALAADPSLADASAAEQLQFFETRVRPILAEHCQSCHGPQKQWAGLRLDSREAILQGGDSGPAAVVSSPEESLLIRAVRHSDEALQMPQDGQLSDQQIADLEHWVRGGLAFPEAPESATGFRNRDYWAFQPLAEPPVPTVQNETWPRTGIDRFILARLEDAGLTPAPDADRRTLIRRLTFDLTGLPPTPEEIRNFLADERPDAVERLIDRLLESPAYGERWGRHWLDVARYADSNGLDENIAHGNAWRYRDYVVASFNSDKPFNQFAIEQLAGDLLPAETEEQRREQLTATGFISVGPKVLAEVNQPKMQMDIVDEQIDTVGRVFLGLTLGCARCHDHKFDPIDATDYYALAGVFKSTRTMDTYIKVARWHENELPSDEARTLRADYERQLQEKRSALEAFVAEASQLAVAVLATDAERPESLESLYPEETKAELKRLRDELTTLEANPPEYPSAMGVTEDVVTDVALHLRGNPLKLGDVVPRAVPAVVQGPPPVAFSPSESGRRELAHWLVDAQNPLTARVIVNRVWRWHFGTGLVRTPDNFGLLGEAPTHPELLDWLAQQFIDGGWSLKSLHRLILNSRTWQQSAMASSEAAALDPENRLLGRMRVRRLQAEEVRDALLAVSGQLDPTLGGSLLKVKNRGYLFDHTSIDTTDYTSQRRSLYLPVIRNNVHDLFQLLDFPDPAVSNGDRAATTVAPQALLMLNSDFVMQAGDALGLRLLTEFETDDARFSELHERAYGRECAFEEQQRHQQFLKEVERALEPSEPDAEARRLRAWSVLCHAILAANEFIYVP